MKKIILFALIVLSLLMFVSCEPENSSGGGETEAETDTDVKDIVVPLPVFGKAENTSRGLLTLPDEYFKIDGKGDSMFASAVMTTMPTMTNLQKGTVSTSSLGGVETDYTVYGFIIKLNKDFCKVNSDGIYLQYNIYDQTDTTKAVGFCDYYYNTNTKCFTYRQSVAYTEEFESLQYSDNRVINLEYNDVYVEDIDNLVFKVGQLTSDGSLGKDAFVDTMNISSKIGNGNLCWHFDRYYVTANEVKEDNGLFTIYSFRQLDDSFTTGQKSYSDYTALETLMKKYTDNGDCEVKTLSERKAVDMSFMNEIYPLLYAYGESIAKHHSTVKGYDSYDAFTKDSFKEIGDEIKNKEDKTGTVEVPCPTIYTYNGVNSKGASTCNLSTFTHTLHFHNLIVSGDTTKKKEDNYKNFGFESYLGEYSSTEEDDIETFTIKKFLKACGIDNEGYITEFIKSNSALEEKCTLNKGTTSSGS